ncbi:MAG: flagellar hook-associated protein 1 [Alphaproteobacteria bacterium]|jgi:flagellar hook-associated protein 1 FlgK|nr:flagellar hook-associated protein 1 [Alphaproteobacteria bacterium]
MSLTQALSTAVGGLRAAQAGLAIVSANVANAETPGYVRKTPVQVATSAGALGVGVRIDSINRELDQYIQRQMRVESSGASYADLRAQFYSRLQNVYGVPGANSTLETVFNDFTSALQALSTSPDSASARSAVMSSAQVLAQQLNSMTGDIQGLRSDAELGLSDAAARANDAMQRISQINRQLGTANSNDATTANLLDQRDRYIDQLAQMMDINVVQNDHNQVTVFTNSGMQLVGTAASTLVFDAQGSMTAPAQWSADPAKRTVGTLLLKGPNGGDVDLIANHAIRSGQIAAYIEMRDQVLVQTQAQIDQIAGGLARSLSDRTTDGTAVTSGAQSGFDIDLSGLRDGNSVRVSYTDNATGARRTLTLVRVDDPAALPLANGTTPDPNDKVVGLDFSGGVASVLGQIGAAIGTTALQFSNPSGSTLRVLDDGGLNKIDVNAVAATSTMTSLTSGTVQLPFFLDAGGAYTGAIRAAGAQTVGFAGRIAVNASLLADPSRLVAYQTTPPTAAGDPTRPNFIYDRLTAGRLDFAPQSGIGSGVAPFQGSLPSYMRQVVSQQGQAADAAANLKDGQDVVFNTLRQRFNDSAGVNIDEEMANLLNLQNSYGASARVLSTVKEMIDTLMRM